MNEYCKLTARHVRYCIIIEKLKTKSETDLTIDDVKGVDTACPECPIVKRVRDGAGESKPIISTGSFMPVLDMLFGFLDIKTVLEFGMGLYSTAYFLGHDVTLYSVENNREWFDRCMTNADKHKCYCYPDENIGNILGVELLYQKFDLVLVDGPTRSRVNCAARSFGRAPLIVLHDSEDYHYDYDQLVIPDNYNSLIFKFNKAWTTLLYSKELETINPKKKVRVE
jgi:hypothetical protein